MEALLRRLPADIAPARDLWPGIAAAIATTADGAGVRHRSRVWTMRIAAAAACIAIGAVTSYFVVAERFATRTAAGLNGAVVARQVDSWLVKPVAQDPGYRKARAQLAGEFFRRIAALPAADRDKAEKGLREIESGLRTLDEALKSNPDSILLQQLVLGTYQQELEYLQNVTSLSRTVPEATHT